MVDALLTFSKCYPDFLIAWMESGKSAWQMQTMRHCSAVHKRLLSIIVVLLSSRDPEVESVVCNDRMKPTSSDKFSCDSI